LTVNWLVSTSVFVDADSNDLLMRTGRKWRLQLIISVWCSTALAVCTLLNPLNILPAVPNGRIMNNELQRIYQYLWPALRHSTIGHHLDFCDIKC